MLAFKRYACSFFLLLCLFSAAWAQSAVVHEVKEGETLFRISKQYGISVAMLLEHNAGITAESLRIGDKLSIPNFAGQTTPLKEHKAKRGETFYGIAKKYGLTVEQLAVHNPHISAPHYKVRRGTVLFIPEVPAKVSTQSPITSPGKTTKQTSATQPVDEVSEQEKQQTSDQNRQQISERERQQVSERERRRDGETVRVALVLPFKSSKGEGARCVEFYRGFLLSTEHFKSAGANIEVYAFDEGTANDSLDEVLQKIDRLNVDMLIAPVYFQHFHSIGKFAEKEDARIVVPFTSKAPIIDSHANVFLLNSPESQELEEVKKLLSAHTETPRYIFLEYLNGNKKSFASQLKTGLSRSGCDVQSIEYPNGTQSVADLLSATAENIIIPNNSNPEIIEELLSLLGGLSELNPDAQCSLLGYSTWSDYLKEHLMERLGKSIYYFTNAFHSDHLPEVANFKATYEKLFNAPMLTTTPRMAMLGYDCALHFISELLAEKKVFLLDAEKPLLQRDFKFVAPYAKGGKVNAGIWLMHYLPDGSLQKCSY